MRSMDEFELKSRSKKNREIVEKDLKRKNDNIILRQIKESNKLEEPKQNEELKI